MALEVGRREDHARFVGDAVVDALEPVVEPAQGLHGRQHAVVPGADDDALGAFERLVEVQALARKGHVPPAGLQVNRGAGAADALVLVEYVAQGAEFRKRRRWRALGHAGDVGVAGHVLERARVVGIHVGRCAFCNRRVEQAFAVRAVHRRRHIRPVLALAHFRPVAGEPGHRQATVDDGVHDRRRNLRHDAGEVPGLVDGGCELDHAFPGTADHAHPVRGPFLPRDPVHHLRDVGRNAPGLVGVRAEGGARAAKVDADHVVPVVDDVLAGGALLVGGDQRADREMGRQLRVFRRVELVLLLVVRAPVPGRLYDGRSRSREECPVAGGAQDVHRDPAAVIDGNVHGRARVPVRDFPGIAFVDVDRGFHASDSYVQLDTGGSRPRSDRFAS